MTGNRSATSGARSPQPRRRCLKPAAIGSRARVLLLAAGVTVVAGCQASPQVLHPLRGIWVTRFDYRVPDDVRQIMDDCAGAGFNAVFFQVRGNATAFYESRYEPWADELSGEDPGWDPLALACELAHERGMQLHAWVNVMPAWRGRKPPTNPRQLYNSHPEWLWYDQYGNRQVLSDFYVSVNPCLPEVRDYLVRVFEDLVSRYDVDGLHLDYIRFPNEPPARPAGSDVDYPRDARTLALFREQTGKAPDEDPQAWVRWRTDQVTLLVQQIHRMVRKTRPQAVLTAAVGPVPERALKHFQDAQRWAQEGLVDAVILMNYVDLPEIFDQRLTPWLGQRLKARVIPGLWFGRHDSRSIEQAAESVCQQIAIARERTGDFCLFAYSSLFESVDPGELVKPTPEQRELRERRRAVVLPCLRQAAEEDAALRCFSLSRGRAKQ
jgi:uncharacterized lipoprotein YddW (UPF0748 family)